MTGAVRRLPAAGPTGMATIRRLEDRIVIRIALGAHRARFRGRRGWRRAYDAIVPQATPGLVRTIRGMVRDSLVPDALQALRAGDVAEARLLRAEIEALAVYLGLVDLREGAPLEARDEARAALVGHLGIDELARALDRRASDLGARLDLSR